MTGIPRQVAVVAAALVNLGVNALAGTGMLFGTTTGEVSDSIQTGVTPAGWAFSIWSVIFVGVLIFAVYQALPRARGSRFDALAVPFILANLLNGLWQVPWLTGNFGLAAVVIVGILSSLVWLYIRLDRMGMSTTERWVLGVPISLFLAWLTVATALNITIALVAAGWEGSPVWPPLLVLVVAGIGSALLWRTGDVAFAAVLVWAFAAIYAANVPSPGDAPGLVSALGVGVLAFAAAVASALRRGRSPLPVTD
jgi:tryptophan-rich sensory protein